MASAAPRACAYQDVRFQDSQPMSSKDYVRGREDELRRDYEEFLKQARHDPADGAEDPEELPTGAPVLALAGICPALAPGDAGWGQIFRE